MIFISTDLEEGNGLDRFRVGCMCNSNAAAEMVRVSEAAPVQLYPVNVTQIMLMISGDVEPNPGPNPR